ncbi:hypothetical protein VTI74DRAFT_1932 [Chaetomium olivicolor]
MPLRYLALQPGRRRHNDSTLGVGPSPLLRLFNNRNSNHEPQAHGNQTLRLAPVVLVQGSREDRFILRSRRRKSNSSFDAQNGGSRVHCRHLGSPAMRSRPQEPARKDCHVREDGCRWRAHTDAREGLQDVGPWEMGSSHHRCVYPAGTTAHHLHALDLD